VRNTRRRKKRPAKRQGVGSCSRRLLEQLLTFDAGSGELEDNGDAEPDDGAEEDGPPY
jgi:hypothetical protein